MQASDVDALVALAQNYSTPAPRTAPGGIGGGKPVKKRKGGTKEDMRLLAQVISAKDKPEQAPEPTVTSGQPDLSLGSATTAMAGIGGLMGMLGGKANGGQ